MFHGSIPPKYAMTAVVVSQTIYNIGQVIAHAACVMATPALPPTPPAPAPEAQ